MEELNKQLLSDKFSKVFSKIEFTDDRWLWALFLDRILKYKNF